MAFIYKGKNRKLLFIHIPRTGGKSIKRSLTGGSFEFFPHFSVSPLYPFVKGKYYIVSFVRNPWDRLVSSYFYIRQYHNPIVNRAKKTLFIGDYDFEEFIKKRLVKKGLLFRDNLFYPQHKFISRGGKLVTDFLGRTESIKEDFDKICKVVGIFNKSLPQINKSKHKHYRNYYTEETKDIVFSLYEKDIKLFNYRF